jgi:flagellar hook protein FlgE
MTANGDYVQGWSADGSGNIDTNAPVSNIVVPVGNLQAPVATTTMSASLNLDSSAATGTNFSDTITIYDSLGTSHQLTLSFTEQSPNNWSYTATLPAGDLVDPTTAQIGSGNLVFTTNGTLDFTQTTTPVPMTLPAFLDGATVGGTVTWNLANTNGSGTITQYDQPSASSSSSQDGQAASQLVNVGLGNGGNILAQYSDGQQVTVGEVALASIANPDSLVAVGSNNYMLSAASAAPNIGVSGTGGRGTIQGASLEASNVDIATQFTDLIVYQRGYEANGKVVTTADTLSQDTINLIQG